MTRIIRARYYPKGDLFSAKLGFQPSYTWRSIWKTCSIIEEGVRWSISSGVKVNIWDDRWLPEQNGGRIWSPRPADNDVCLVSHIIDHELRVWDRQTIQKLFLPFEAEQIYRIPISRRILDDVLMWPWEKDYTFSVRSAYHLIQKKKKNSGAGPSELKTKWKWLWKMNVPPKRKRRNSHSPLL